MGSIASVLQWHCSECALINPTESARCARCGLTRFRSDERASLDRRQDRATSVAAERSDSARHGGGKAAHAGDRARRSTRGREDGECPATGEASSEESTPPTPPPRADRLTRNPTLSVGQPQCTASHGWESRSHPLLLVLPALFPMCLPKQSHMGTLISYLKTPETHFVIELGIRFPYVMFVLCCL